MSSSATSSKIAQLTTKLFKFLAIEVRPPFGGLRYACANYSTNQISRIMLQFRFRVDYEQYHILNLSECLKSILVRVASNCES